MALMVAPALVASHNYADALRKCILFFECQRSGPLPPTQRVAWRKASGLHDGSDNGVDLVGGYYDAGDNVKFNFPMAFTTTMLAWSVLEFGQFMGTDLQHAMEAIKWATDYFLKATSHPDQVYVQVGEPYSDHSCWERPEDMDTSRASYSVNGQRPGSEVSAEIAAALAASSMVFKRYNSTYAALLQKRAASVFKFADKFRGSYSDGSLHPAVCPFYCDFNGYWDELIWAAAWLYRTTQDPSYWKYVLGNIHTLENPYIVRNLNGYAYQQDGSFAEFGWDAKHAGINVLVSKLVMNRTTYLNTPFVAYADKFVCSIIPESPMRSVTYSRGGLLFKPGGSNLQHTTSLSFLLLAYSRYLNRYNRKVNCGNVIVSPLRLRQYVKGQADYVLGSNPLGMSYMVGYGNRFPQKIHHRGSSLPCLTQHPTRIECHEGSIYFASKSSNPNLLVGAIVGGPSSDDSYADSRYVFVQSEPTTYINAPFVGVLAYLKAHFSS
ncbi:endoglucanase 4-like [Malania oleifera]|uniref:endoglucanase 4-like n=1 Tax=Malania oleifera TaxID=397392 RepID=UPI0025ADC16D|nr:endoglucanase 4-like [Malania oleifera]